jgi:hypothetical protein
MRRSNLLRVLIAQNAIDTSALEHRTRNKTLGLLCEGKL